MKHEKTFEAINKLRDVEIELHRLKNALEMANRGLESKRTWVGLTDEEIDKLDCVYALWDDGESCTIMGIKDFARALEAKLKEKNS